MRRDEDHPDSQQMPDSAVVVDINDARPHPDASDINRLARLDPIDYDHARKTEADRLGVRASTLDRAVATRRRDLGVDGGDGLQGRPLDLPTPEPWPDPVDGGLLLTEIAGVVQRHVALPDAAADAIALWVLHSHCLDAAQISPRLAITSPEKRCGKTTLLNLISCLVAKPAPASNITAAALFRTIEKARPTLLIDEADTFLAASDELRGILNSGHNRASAFVIRTVGDDHEPRLFNTWSPVAIAAIGKLPATLADRSVSISLRRRLPTEAVERLRMDRTHHLSVLARKAARWTADHLEAITAGDPDVPGALHDRAMDNWRALLAIADEAAGDWPDRARSAASTLSGDNEASLDSLRVELLTDIRAVFDGRGSDRISSRDLVAALVAMADRPWPEVRDGRSLTERRLATLLAPFGIAPGTVRIGTTTPKGYHLSSFDDALARYTTPRTATPPQPAASRHFEGEDDPQQTPSCCGSETAKSPQPAAPCGGVADQTPPSARKKRTI